MVYWQTHWKKWAADQACHSLFCQRKCLLCYDSWHVLQKCADIAQHGTTFFGSANKKASWSGLCWCQNSCIWNLHHLHLLLYFVHKAIAAAWSNVETFKLVEICGEEEIHPLLKGCTHNKQVYAVYELSHHVTNGYVKLSSSDLLHPSWHHSWWLT